MNTENKFIGQLARKFFDFITLGLFENDVKVPEEEEKKPEHQKPHHHLQSVDGVI